jgi:hypothetical protein
MLDRVQSDWQGYNISLLVATCAGVCPLVYGSGNPDISGIGVSLPHDHRCLRSFLNISQAMISYLIQAIVTITIGPPLAFVLVVFELDLEPLTRRRLKIWKLLANVAQSAHQGNIFVAVSVLVASVIRVNQIAPIAELDFIRYLAVYQFAIALGATICLLATFGTSTRKTKLLLLYNIIISALFITVLAMNGFPRSVLYWYIFGINYLDIFVRILLRDTSKAETRPAEGSGCGLSRFSVGFRSSTCDSSMGTSASRRCF